MHPDRLEEIESAHWRFPHEALEKAISQWLKKAYDTQKYGVPSWQKLVAAIACEAGGNNPAAAKIIALEHPGEGEREGRENLTTFPLSPSSEG